MSHFGVGPKQPPTQTNLSTGRGVHVYLRVGTGIRRAYCWECHVFIVYFHLKPLCVVIGFINFFFREIYFHLVAFSHFVEPQNLSEHHRKLTTAPFPKADHVTAVFLQNPQTPYHLIIAIF